MTYQLDEVHSHSDAVNRLCQIPADQFRKAFLEWIAESHHQGWEGFKSCQLIGFGLLMDDFASYCENGGLELVEGYTTIGKYVLHPDGSLVERVLPVRPNDEH